MEYLTVAEVADLLKVNPETVKRWLRSGEMRGSILGDRAGWRVEGEEVRRFMEARQPEPEREEEAKAAS